MDLVFSFRLAFDIYGKGSRGFCMVHKLKIWPQYFGRVKDGSKTFEVRDNDRGFQPGDKVILEEYDPEPIEPAVSKSMLKGYTGESLEFTVGYVFVLSGHQVVFSLLPISK